MSDPLKPGLRDHLVTEALRDALSSLDADLIEKSALDPAEAPDRLARHLGAASDDRSRHQA